MQQIYARTQILGNLNVQSWLYRIIRYRKMLEEYIYSNNICCIKLSVYFCWFAMALQPKEFAFPSIRNEQYEIHQHKRRTINDITWLNKQRRSITCHHFHDSHFLQH